MKRINKEINVLSDGRLPTEFYWNNRSYRIESIEDNWVLQGNWWVNEEKRRYFRVLTQQGIAVIYFRETEKAPPVWILDELFD